MAGVDRRTPVRDLLTNANAGADVIVTGWVKTSRFSKNVSFVHIFDGSTPKTVQIVLNAELAEQFKSDLGIGAAVRIRGEWVASPGGEQSLEVSASDITIVGQTHPSEYPLQKKRTSLENLRTIAHLRPRTNTMQSVFRVRNALANNIHRFFQDRGFMWVHTPILSTADAEGAGEMFRVLHGDDPEFFGGPAYLTVSGQLNVETFGQAFTDVYTFGPTFRAEKSNTPRHACEFWMIEPEIYFANLDDVIALATDFVRTVTKATMEQCPDDFVFFNKFIEKGLLDSLNAAISADFARVSHDEAQDILVASGKKFEFKVGRGESLQAEHERYLAEEHFNGPVFVTDYPMEQKAFYMRLNDDQRTVAATDLLVPRIGEMIGGSQREERLDVLDDLFRRHNVPAEDYEWYRDLRRFGSAPHGGFGLGFERMLMWMTGMKNIRDVIPYPRTPGQAGY